MTQTDQGSANHPSPETCLGLRLTNDREERSLAGNVPAHIPARAISRGGGCSRTDSNTQGRSTHVLLVPRTIWQLSPSRWCQRPRTEEPELTTAAQEHTHSATASPQGQEWPQWQKTVKDLPKCGHRRSASKPTVWGRRHMMALGEVAASWLSCSQSSIGTTLTWQSNCLPPSPAPRFSFNQPAPWKVQLEGRSSQWSVPGSFQQGQGQVSDQLQFALRSFTCMALSAVNTGSVWGVDCKH